MNDLVETICEAWRSKKPEILAGVLANTFAWYDSPFEEVISDNDDLVARWHQDISNQENIVVEAHSIMQSDEFNVANWRAEFDRNGEHEILDGIFFIRTNEDNKITEFRMWWVGK